MSGRGHLWGRGRTAIGLERWAWAVRWPMLGREASRAGLGEAFCCLDAYVKFPLQVFSWQDLEPSGPMAVYQNSEQKPSWEVCRTFGHVHFRAKVTTRLHKVTGHSNLLSGSFLVLFFSFTIRLNPRIYMLIVLLVVSSRLVCIHTYVCIYVCRNQRPTVLGGFFLLFSFLFWARASHLYLALDDWARLAGQWALRIFLFLPPSTGIRGMHAPRPPGSSGFLMWVLGMNLKFSCLCSKHLTHWAISSPWPHFDSWTDTWRRRLGPVLLDVHWTFGQTQALFSYQVYPHETLRN